MSERPCEHEHEYSTSSGPVMYVNDEGELVEAEEAHAVDEQHVHDDEEEDVEDEPQLPGQGTAQGNSSVAASTREPVFSRPTVVDWYHIPEEQIDTLQCDCRCHSGPPHFADRSFSNRNTQGYWGGRIYVRFRGWHKGCQNFADSSVSTMKSASVSTTATGAGPLVNMCDLLISKIALTNSATAAVLVATKIMSHQTTGRAASMPVRSTATAPGGDSRSSRLRGGMCAESARVAGASTLQHLWLSVSRYTSVTALGKVGMLVCGP